MNYRAWIWTTVFGIAGLAGINLAISYAADTYGILRDPHGRKLAANGLHTISTDDRIAKYLLNERYVPANFDGLLVGSSTTANWEMEALHGFTIYNESVAAGNVAEQRMLVEQALPRGHFKIAICVLSPYMLASHNLKEGLGQVTRREALGSINSLGEQITKLMIKLHLQKQTFFWTGSRELFVPMRVDRELPKEIFTLDPEALTEYRELVQELLERGVAIVYVVPPIYEPLYKSNAAQFAKFAETVRPVLPEAPIIDFSTEAYRGYREDVRNFSDGLHMSPEGAEKISVMLEARLQELAQGGR